MHKLYTYDELCPYRKTFVKEFNTKDEAFDYAEKNFLDFYEVW